MRAAAIGLVVGTCWLQSRAALPAASTQLLLLALAALLAGAAAVLARKSQRLFGSLGMGSRLALPVVLISAVLAGYAWSAMLAQHRLDAALPPALEGRDIQLT